MLAIKNDIFTLVLWCFKMGQRITIGATDDSNKIPLDIIRRCGIGVPPNGILDINESLYLTIGYLLQDE